MSITKRGLRLVVYELRTCMGESISNFNSTSNSSKSELSLPSILATGLWIVNM